jgi:hypothetical protein
MREFSMVARWATTLVTAVIALCGVAAADTIVIPGVDTNRGEYNVWIGENSADMIPYFAGVILIQLTDTAEVFNRDTLCAQLFTNIYLGQQFGTNVVTLDSQEAGTMPPNVEGDAINWAIWTRGRAAPTVTESQRSFVPSRLTRPNIRGAHDLRLQNHPPGNSSANLDVPDSAAPYFVEKVH